MKIPKKLNLANLPTPIEEINQLSLPKGQRLFLKRDDFTGIEVSGNKIRKLEFIVADALDQGCDTLITCGGIQSNHARATAAVAAKLGLKCILVLNSATRVRSEGNLLLDHLFGAKIHLIPPKDFANNLNEIMQSLADDVAAAGGKACLIPIGASNALGCFGYYHALEEIIEQEKKLQIHFDTIVCTVGSAGTYAGMVFANHLLGANKTIVGFNIADTAEHFQEVTRNLWPEFCLIAQVEETLTSELHIIDGYAGRGYALNTPEEMDYFRGLAQRTGTIFDSVYTGKAMRGLLNELESSNVLLAKAKNILFIHTGGQFGLFPKAQEFGL